MVKPHVCVHACMLFLTHIPHTHTKLAFGEGSEGRGSEKNREGQGKLSLWLVTQSVWDDLSLPSAEGEQFFPSPNINLFNS